MKPIVNQKKIRLEHGSKRIKKKKGKENEDRFLRRCMISQEVEEEEENTEGDAGKNIYFSI